MMQTKSVTDVDFMLFYFIVDGALLFTCGEYADAFGLCAMGTYGLKL
jgi:hypothetical protein